MERTAALRTSGTLISTVVPAYVVMSQHQWTVTTELSFSCQISKPIYVSRNSSCRVWDRQPALQLGI